MVFEKIQFFSLVFSVVTFVFIFGLVKHRRIKEEYSLLWFGMSIFFIYLSLDKQSIDRFGDMFGIAYKPSILMLFTTGFIFLVLVHVTVVITRLSEQNTELIQEMGLAAFRATTGKDLSAPTGATLVIVPAYNEEGNIDRVIGDLKSTGLNIDILVINDGSADNTSAVAAATGQAMVLDLPNNLGIGGAVRTGFKFAQRHQYLTALQFDGDGQHIASEIPKLMASLRDQQANMVIGSRFLQKHEGFRSTFVRRIGIRTFQILNSLLIGQRITDNTSGFRAYDKKAIDFLARYYPVDYPEPEAVILLGRNGFKIAEEFTLMQERRDGGSSITGFTGLYYMIKVLLAILMTALRKPLVNGLRSESCSVTCSSAKLKQGD